jgi:hypothetical protein
MKHARKTALIAGLALGAIASAASADIQLYGREGFRGREFAAQGSIDNLEGSRLNDRASSAIVRDEPWLVCSEAYFRGHCVTLRPGEYPSLAAMGLDNDVSSARALHGERYGYRDHDRGDRWHGSRVTLYEGPNFSGRAMTIDREEVRNLDPLGFNDRASSMRIEGAPWVFCSDAFFQGDCRTFAPGEYAYLPNDLANKISSGHIAQSGPYASDYRR